MARDDAASLARETAEPKQLSYILPPHPVREGDEVIGRRSSVRGEGTRWPPVVEEVTWLCETVR